VTLHAQAPPGTLCVLDLAGAPLPFDALGVGPLAAQSLRGQLRHGAVGARARAWLWTHCGAHTLAATKRPCSSKVAEGEPQTDSSSTRKQQAERKRRKKAKESKPKKRHKAVRLCTGHRLVNPWKDKIYRSRRRSLDQGVEGILPRLYEMRGNSEATNGHRAGRRRRTTSPCKSTSEATARQCGGTVHDTFELESLSKPSVSHQ
jgi:hypothetical protein